MYIVLGHSQENNLSLSLCLSLYILYIYIFIYIYIYIYIYIMPSGIRMKSTLWSELTVLSLEG